ACHYAAAPVIIKKQIEIDGARQVRIGAAAAAELILDVPEHVSLECVQRQFRLDGNDSVDEPRIIRMPERRRPIERGYADDPRRVCELADGSAYILCGIDIRADADVRARCHQRLRTISTPTVRAKRSAEGFSTLTCTS